MEFAGALTQQRQIPGHSFGAFPAQSNPSVMGFWFIPASPETSPVWDDKFLQRQQWFVQTGNKSPNQSGFFVWCIMPTEGLASIMPALRDRDNVPHRSFACAPEDGSVMRNPYIRKKSACVTGNPFHSLTASKKKKQTKKTQMISLCAIGKWNNDIISKNSASCHHNEVCHNSLGFCTHRNNSQNTQANLHASEWVPLVSSTKSLQATTPKPQEKKKSY